MFFLAMNPKMIARTDPIPSPISPRTSEAMAIPLVFVWTIGPPPVAPGGVRFSVHSLPS